MRTTTKLTMRPVAELIPYARNAREHSEEQIQNLRASLREFGFVAPLLIDANDNILAGHGRLLAARAEGMTEVPCVLVEHLTDVQRRAYILADNRLAEQASWDAELVSLELQELKDAGYDLNLTGFDEDDILLEESNDVREDDFEPELPAEPVSRPGQIYQLGRHRLMCGNATRESDVAALMDGAQAQLLLTDPPYNVDVTGGTADHLKIENDHQDDAAFLEFLDAALRNGRAVLEPGASFYIWHADGAPGRLFRDACYEVGLEVRQCLIWVKQSATLGRQDYRWQHEPCLHGQTEPEELDCGDTWDDHEACLYGWKDGRAHLWCSDRKQTTVLEYDRPTKNKEHPTMKPVRLFAYQVANSTLREAVVLDLFAGSGTTAIACEQLGRSAYLMESDPRFVDVILRRWEAFTGEKAVLLHAS
ncbi:putative methyltransferase [Oscillibacter valericigenes Sjm18-20]|nr:putative methyltransferase [Oscillibacter valericigenes Sjm18-20]